MVTHKKKIMLAAVLIVAAVALTSGIIYAMTNQPIDQTSLESGSPAGLQMPPLNDPPDGLDNTENPDGLQR